MKLRHLGLLALMTYSFPFLAAAGIQEKEGHVEFIEKIGQAAPSLSLDAYKREREYARRDLPLNVRAYNEASVLAEKIKRQVVRSYEAAIEEHGNPERAFQEISFSVNRDLELAAPEFKKELSDLSLQTLSELKNGGISTPSSLDKLAKAVLPGIKERSRYLDDEVMSANIIPQADFVPSSSGGKDSEKLSYGSVDELMDSLVSNRESTRWVSTSNQGISTSQLKTTEKSINYQLKIEFLGVAVEAGPMISFKRVYTSSANIMLEELNPSIGADGNFDFWKRDRSGVIIKKDGKPQRRFMAFYCSIELNFITEYKGSGEFRIAGAGPSGSASRSFSNNVSMNTRRILIPDNVGGKTVTVDFLADLCHRHFLNAKLNKDLTVEQSLNVAMKSVVSSLRFSHQRTNCAVDSQCVKWFNTELVPLWRAKTYPRCVTNETEGYRSCELRGLEDFSCKVYKQDGSLISTGDWELDCDKGLKCVQTQAAGFMKRAKGKCMPANPKTYRDPKKYPRRDYIIIN